MRPNKHRGPHDKRPLARILVLGFFFCVLALFLATNVALFGQSKTRRDRQGAQQAEAADAELSRKLLDPAAVAPYTGHAQQGNLLPEQTGAVHSASDAVARLQAAVRGEFEDASDAAAQQQAKSHVPEPTADAGNAVPGDAAGGAGFTLRTKGAAASGDGGVSSSSAEGAVGGAAASTAAGLAAGAATGTAGGTAAAEPPVGVAKHRSTLVVYVYNAVDEEQQRNFDFFLRFGVSARDGVTYRILVVQGGAVLELQNLPELPANGQYIPVEGGCTSTWGVLGLVLGRLPVEAADALVVVDSSVKGPFVPPYAAQALHWTEAFTGKLQGRTRLVGAAISCEGAPQGGDAAGEWRSNPYVMPYAWATDKAGLTILRSDPSILKCYADPWDTRYYSDSGASLAVLAGGGGIDCLLTRYQGVDWWDHQNWQCNGRVRPDGEMMYDGVSITPYETVFVPTNAGTLANRWTTSMAAQLYDRWMTAQAASKPDITSNAADSWEQRAIRMAAMTARGPGCFDFNYYLEHNPDLATLAEAKLDLWEHFLVLGQFQGRQHRFSCPVQISNAFRISYARARGRRCFDHNYYVEQNPDLKGAGMSSAADIWGHFAGFGQFEGRPMRYTCADTMQNLTAGFDAVPLTAIPEAAAAKGDGEL